MHTVVLFSLLLSVVQATITGQKQCSDSMCVTGLHDDTTNTDTYTITGPKSASIPASKFGWASIGFGSKMAGSPMLIVWPNSDGSITLSQRMASGNVQPKAQTLARSASLVNDTSFANSSDTSISFTMPSDSSQVASGSTFDLLWAYSGTNPGSSADDADIKKHSGAGVWKDFNLLAEYPATSSSSSSSSSGSSGGGKGSLSSNHILLAHIIAGALATMLFLPLGILTPRYARGMTTKRWWFPAHSANNGIIAFGLIVAAYAIGNTQFGDSGGVSPHPNLALALLILMCVQIVLGIIAHWVKFIIPKLHTASGRGPAHFLHVGVGLATVIVGWVTVWYGMGDQWTKNVPYPPVGTGYKAGWAVIVGVVILAYLFGVIFFLPKQKAMEKAKREEGKQEQDGTTEMRQTSPVSSQQGLV